MTDVHDYVTVLCPFDQIQRAVASFVGSLPVENDTAQLPIRVQLGDLTLERKADLTLRHARAYPGYEIMDIAWAPHDDAPYPHFSGILSAEDEGGNFCRLDLDGSYAPPLGPAGALLDAAVGKRIAEAAIHDVLERLRTGVELAFQTGATVD